jgi:chromosome partitioning protein
VQIISFMNMKGGVGKTTLAVNVAHGLARLHRKNVLVVDADPQFNATQYLLGTDAYLKHISDPSKGTLRDIFVPQRPGPVNTVAGSSRGVNRTKMALANVICEIFNGGAGRGKLDLIPSTLQLMDIETSRRQTEGRLKAYLTEKATGYDYVIIDCPPTISIFTQAAILASDKYLVPIKPDPLSVIGLPLLERWLEDYADDAGATVKSVGLVYTMVRGNTPPAMAEVMRDLRQERGNEVFNAYLSESVHVSSSVDYQLPVFLFKRNSKTGNEIEAITKEFLDRTTGA